MSIAIFKAHTSPAYGITTYEHINPGKAYYSLSEAVDDLDMLGDRIKVTYKSGESATFTVVAVRYGGDYLTNWKSGMAPTPFLSAIAHEVDRYDILERPKVLPTRKGAQISAMRTATGETLILTLTDSYLPWRGFTDDGEVFGLVAENFDKYLDSWEVVKA